VEKLFILIYENKKKKWIFNNLVINN